MFAAVSQAVLKVKLPEPVAEKNLPVAMVLRFCFMGTLVRVWEAMA